MHTTTPSRTTTWGQTDIPIGRCAWDASLLADEMHAEHVEEHPSLIVVDAARHDQATMQACATRATSCPMMLIEKEPVFVRHFRETILRHLDALRRSSIDVIAVHVEEPADLKAGGLMQTMMQLRDQGVVRHIGVCHGDARAAEWLVENAGARVLGTHYGLTNQHAAHRVIPKAAEYGMACIRLTPTVNEDDLRFALMESNRVLPLCNQPIPVKITPFSQEERQSAWMTWQASHEPPLPLDRGRPPE